MEKEIIISEKTQQAMMQFFLKTSVPRILEERKQQEKEGIK